MATAVSAKHLLPTQRVPFTPLSTDVFVVESFNVVQSPNTSVPAYGTPHDTMSKLQTWPDHKFCLQTEPDDTGNYQRWYVADQGTQQLYNYEISDAGPWRSITQTFIIPRADYVPLPFNPAATYPPPGNPPISSIGYQITSTQEQRIGEPKLDSLYVAVQVIREKVNDTQLQYSVDLDTNVVQTTTIQKVAAGTLGSAVNASGLYTNINPDNTLWGISTTQKAAGLAGNAVLGVANRVLYYRDNYTWPRVLNYINIQPVLSDPGDIYSPALRYSWAPVWLADAFDGPCNYTLVERWTLAKPVFDGDSGWNTGTAWATNTVYSSVTPSRVNINGLYYRCVISHTSGVFANNLAAGKWVQSQPLIPQETPMLKTEIVFEGDVLQIGIAACLHERLSIWDTQFSQVYPSTNPTRWPATVLTRVTVSPDQGGYLTRMFYADAPSTAGVASAISLTLTAESATGFTLQGVIGSTVAAGNSLLYIATDPNFNSGFLGDYNGYNLGGGATVTKVVTGAERGVTYYAKIVRSGVTSNLCICFTDPQPELQVLNSGQTILSGAAASALTTAPSAAVGAQSTLSLTLQSIGLESLSSFSAVITGTDASMFTVGAFPVSLPPSETAPWEVYFTPTATGLKTATITITSNAFTTYVLNVAGTGVAPEIQVEQPANTILTDGSSTIDFGTVTTGSADKVFQLLNVGNDTLRLISGEITGDNAADYTFSVPIPVTELAESGETSFTVTFDPVEDDEASSTRTALLSITSDDADENPFTVNLTGVSQNPTAPGSVDLTWDANANGAVYGIAHQTDGKAIIVGAFTVVDGATCNRIARVDATDGSVDATFDTDPGADDDIFCVAIQTDGKVIVGGGFHNIAGAVRNCIARLNTDGTIDAGFNPNANGIVRCIGIQSDGKVIIGGEFTTVGGGTEAYIARLDTAGAIDATFSSEVGTVDNPGPVYGIQILTDGRVAVVGDWWDSGNTTPPPTTPPPTTVPPTTPPPTTVPPTTPPPTTPPPTTPPPVTTPPPTTPPPTTPPPVTTPPPTTPPPTTPPPLTTPPPTTPPPTTPPPVTTAPPTTPPPSTTPPP